MLQKIQIVGISLIVVIVVVIGIVLSLQSHVATSAKDQAIVRDQVTSFGNYLKSVSLTVDHGLLKSDIQQAYGQFVTPELLSSWLADSTLAPGSATSSPWPDHIDIAQVSPQGQGYIVSGTIVMMSSTGITGNVPVIVFLENRGGKWLISTFQEQKSN